MELINTLSDDLNTGDYIHSYKGKGYIIAINTIKPTMRGKLPTPSHLIGKTIITLNLTPFGNKAIQYTTSIICTPDQTIITQRLA